MVNENLINFFNDKYGKEINSVRVADPVANEDLYPLFKLMELPILPFIVEVRGYSFKEVHLNFVVTSWEKKIINIQSYIEFEVERIYPIPVGYVGSLVKAKRFAPMLDPMDPEKIKTPLDKNWFHYRAISDGAASDKLSKFLNKRINGDKLWKQHNFVISYQEGNWITTFSDKRGAEIIIIPTDKPNTVQIQVSEFEKFTPKKDNFFPKWKITKTLQLIQQVFELYNEFLSSNELGDYPRDKYLNGPEAFVCVKCDSIVFPDKIHVTYKKFITFKTICPNCGKKSKILSHIDDERILEVASELFWICPKDLIPFKVVKEIDKKNDVEIMLLCESCNKKVKKTIQKEFYSIVEKKKEQPSPNLEKTTESFVKYNY